MRAVGQLAGVAVGVVVGAIATQFYLGQPRPAAASSNDRYQDFIMATGAVALNPRVQTDGVWMLDYRTGKLLGTVIDRNVGRTVGWAEVDMTAEFGLAPRADVHFLMTAGYVSQGQSALYVAETTTGKFGVYTMGPAGNGTGVVIRRHEVTSFRPQAGDAGLPVPAVAPPAAPPLGAGVVPPPVPPPPAVKVP